MTRFFRSPNRKQIYLLPLDMLEWGPDDDIVHLILDAVEMMDMKHLKGSVSHVA